MNKGRQYNTLMKNLLKQVLKRTAVNAIKEADDLELVGSNCYRIRTSTTHAKLGEVHHLFQYSTKTRLPLKYSLLKVNSNKLVKVLRTLFKL